MLTGPFDDKMFHDAAIIAWFEGEGEGRGWDGWGAAEQGSALYFLLDFVVFLGIMYYKEHGKENACFVIVLWYCCSYV
jgi:hypothetical protein